MPMFIAALLAAMTWGEAYVVLGVASFAIAGAAALVIRETPPAAGARVHRALAAGKRAAPTAPALHDQDLRETVRTARSMRCSPRSPWERSPTAPILPHILVHLVNKGMGSVANLAKG